jgi:hypothetical protein
VDSLAPAAEELLESRHPGDSDFDLMSPEATGSTALALTEAEVEAGAGAEAGAS